MPTSVTTPLPNETHTFAPSVAGILSAAAAERPAAAPHRMRTATGYCNERLEIEFSDGEVLMIKRAHFAWGAPRLRASRLAARLLRRRTGVIAPRHVDVEEDARGRPIEAYWRIPLPTLGELWPDLPDRERPQALRSWGALLRRVHKVKLAGHGTLARAAHCPRHRLADFLHAELRQRLLPALEQSWPVAVHTARQLAESIDALDAWSATRPVVLVHNDYHMGNVLCERRPRSIRCVGVIDLETAWSGPPEADVAQVQVLHGAAFGYPLPKGWDAHFLDGYAAPLDHGVLAFFRVFHLLNLGYFATRAGWRAHVRDIEGEITRDLGRLRLPS